MIMEIEKKKAKKNKFVSKLRKWKIKKRREKEKESINFPFYGA
jgi:hypothetical protein